jgi:hypothetical protein
VGEQGNVGDLHFIKIKMDNMQIVYKKWWWYKYNVECGS